MGDQLRTFTPVWSRFTPDSTRRYCLVTSNKPHATPASEQGSENLDEPLSEARVENVQNSTLVEQRRDQICDAALKLFLEKGYASTTIRDICAASGVNQASIYDYVANKNDILRRLLNKLWFRPDVPNLGERLKNERNLSLQENLENYYRDNWSKKREGILLAYRTVPYMQADDRKAMRVRERSVAKELAEQLEEITGLPANDPSVEVTVQMINFMAAFAPMRDWMISADNETTVRVTAAGAVAMIEQLAKEKGL